MNTQKTAAIFILLLALTVSAVRADEGVFISGGIGGGILFGFSETIPMTRFSGAAGYQLASGLALGAEANLSLIGGVIPGDGGMISAALGLSAEYRIPLGKLTLAPGLVLSGTVNAGVFMAAGSRITPRLRMEFPTDRAGWTLYAGAGADLFPESRGVRIAAHVELGVRKLIK
jgi:hypothetical protein